MALNHIRELDEEWSGEDEPRTWRALVAHVRLIHDADLAYPIILSADGAVMDGRHRVAKALLEAREHIEAVQFDRDPEADHVGKGPAGTPATSDTEMFAKGQRLTVPYGELIAALASMV